MQAADIMTRDVATVAADAKIAVAAALMLEHRVSGLPVVNNAGALVGIVTEGDLLHRHEIGTDGHKRSRLREFLLGDGRKAAEYVQSHTQRVGDLMTTEVSTVVPEASLQEVVDQMEAHRVKRVPVVRDGALLGVVSRHDLLRVLVAPRPAAPAASDEEVERRLREELSAARWTAAANVGVSVDAGVVRLSGVIFDERLRRALVVAAENVAPGVVVDDQLVWVEPNAGMLSPA